MKIIIAGPGCARCIAVEETMRKVCAVEGVAAEITHVYDMAETARLGVMLTPAVLIDGKIVLSGKAPSEAEAKKLLGL